MRLLCAAVTAALFATGCSGGGGGGGGGNGGDPPIADAGDDADARLYQAYTLDGSQSADPEGEDLSFTWSVLSAPDGSAVTLTSGGAAANVAFTPDAEGIYLFGLVVGDGKKVSTLDTVEVTVELRVAVFADSYGEAARELEIYGAGQVDDYYAWPDSYLAAKAGDIAIFFDLRDRRETLIAYRVAGGTQELLASAEEISNVVAAGDHVVWSERRDGQLDLFTRDLVTGEEIRITSSEEFEALGGIGPDFVTFRVSNPPYGDDVFMYDFGSHGLTNLSDMDPDGDFMPITDGETIVYTSLAATDDVYAYDVSSQTTAPIAVATTAAEAGYGISGDFVILGITTSSTPTLYRHQLSSGARTPIESGFSYVAWTQGDYCVYVDGSTVRAYRLSTNTLTDVFTSVNWGGALSLNNGVVAWNEYNSGTGMYEVKYRTLPAGAVSTIAGTGDAYGVVEVLDSGIAWEAHDGDYIYDVFYSADGGVTTDLASDGKVFLTDRLADYDVAIVGSDVDSSFQTDTFDALSAAGIPILSFDREYNALASHYEDDYALVLDGADCDRAAIRFSNSTHPAFAGFPSGSYSMMDEPNLPGDYGAVYIDADEMALPSGYTSLATYDVQSTCDYEGEDAIVTFTNDDGVAVILDGVGITDVPFWTTARRELILSELRYLASTRAP